MAGGVVSLGALRLAALYNIVSRAGQFESDVEVAELTTRCESIQTDLPPHQAIVNLSLRDFFAAVADSFDELAVGSISWPRLDAVILEAVNYIAKGTVIVDATRIANDVSVARLKWTGQ